MSLLSRAVRVREGGKEGESAVRQGRKGRLGGGEAGRQGGSVSVMQGRKQGSEWSEGGRQGGNGEKAYEW